MKSEKTIRVEVKNSILGDSVFWEGPVGRIEEIRNLIALQQARLVAKDGRARVMGMWVIEMVEQKTDHD